MTSDEKGIARDCEQRHLFLLLRDGNPGCHWPVPGWSVGDLLGEKELEKGVLRKSLFGVRWAPAKGVAAD